MFCTFVFKYFKQLTLTKFIVFKSRILMRTENSKQIIESTYTPKVVNSLQEYMVVQNIQTQGKTAFQVAPAYNKMNQVSRPGTGL